MITYPSYGVKSSAPFYYQSALYHYELFLRLNNLTYCWIVKTLKKLERSLLAWSLSGWHCYVGKHNLQ